MLYFSIQNRVQGRTSKVSEAAGARCDFLIGLSSDCRRIVVESSFYWRKQFTEFPLKSWTYRFRGRRSIWWGWWLTVLAPRIVNDVSCVTRINHGIHFAWQAQYLLRLEVDFACSAHWKWRFIWGADQSWDSFCVAGAVFGEVRGWLWLLRVLEMTFHMWRGSIMRFILRGRRSIWWNWRHLPCCSAHCKWRFICDADQSWDSFCVAGAVIGEFEGWLYLLRALEMTFHMWRGSLMAFILRGRCSIWWRWIVIPVAPLIVNDVSYVTRINHHSHFAW